MITVIKEDQIASAEIWQYDGVFAVRVGEYSEDVEIWHAREIATMYSSLIPAELKVHRQLLVEVDEPYDPEVVDRLRVACSDAWANR